ncbi:MAG TPA: tetratricopeptide repeat protein [Burkholderiales bacterium]|nr:tetratricopeptide repeat protein [Burkholderiales bacterium]
MRALLLLLAALIAGCAAVAPEQPAPPQQQPENAAVASLMQSAHADADAGRLASAEASLERALRIDPRDPRLWQQLAGVRLQQGDYAQAESLAARSNSWAGADDVLRAENWRLIAEARRARGDDAGAHEALERAEHYGR